MQEIKSQNILETRGELENEKVTYSSSGEENKENGRRPHFIKENIERGGIEPIYTPSLQNADILTKALPRTGFEDLYSKLGMLNIYNPT